MFSIRCIKTLYRLATVELPIFCQMSVYSLNRVELIMSNFSFGHNVFKSRLLQKRLQECKG